jgi:hypothetical protein
LLQVAGVLLLPATRPTNAVLVIQASSLRLWRLSLETQLPPSRNRKRATTFIRSVRQAKFPTPRCRHLLPVRHLRWRRLVCPLRLLTGADAESEQRGIGATRQGVRERPAQTSVATGIPGPRATKTTLAEKTSTGCGYVSQTSNPTLTTQKARRSGQLTAWGSCGRSKTGIHHAFRTSRQAGLSHTDLRVTSNPISLCTPSTAV